MGTIHVINGPNLNLLGGREKDIYGEMTLHQIDAMVRDHGQALGHEVTCRQSNHEGDLVTWVQEAGQTADGIIINAGAYSHSSIALHDALRTAKCMAVEVHLSNIFSREDFRHHSTLSPVVAGVICGLGPQGYTLALTAIDTHLKAAAPTATG